jgi:RNA polymerase sigma-70 factor (sigma-E family)
MGSRTDGFDAFVEARWPALLHLARLLTGGDAHRAEDLLQDALVKLWFAWSRVGDQHPEAYVRRILVRACAKSARRRWWGERPTAVLPDHAGHGDTAELVGERDRLEAALACLPARQRTAVVLRYYQDLSEAQVADLLGCPAGTVRSLASRGISKLRTMLDCSPVS